MFVRLQERSKSTPLSLNVHESGEKNVRTSDTAASHACLIVIQRMLVPASAEDHQNDEDSISSAVLSLCDSCIPSSDREQCTEQDQELSSRPSSSVSALRDAPHTGMQPETFIWRVRLDIALSLKRMPVLCSFFIGLLSLFLRRNCCPVHWP